METLQQARISRESGIVGDYRGAMRRGPYKRQVTVLEREDWNRAMAEIERNIPWEQRRANLLVEGIDLPQMAGKRLRIGMDVVLEITRETDPCERMEAIAPGLRAALTPDWRGGVCTFVISGGTIMVGDEITIEDAVSAYGTA